MRTKYYLVYDQSTSATKLLLIKEGEIVKRLDARHEQIYPNVGWVEHDPLEIWENVQNLFQEMLGECQIEKQDIESISITNQRETFLAWSKKTGKPFYNAIVWQCNRSDEICERMVQENYGEIIQEKTGLRLDPYFSGSKIKWLVENVPEIKVASESNELAIGTIDSWLIWNMTNGSSFATEPSNACRTLLYNIRENCWDEELCKIFGIKINDLPLLKKSSDLFGTYQGIPIRGVMADSQAALFGQNAVKAGEVKVTLGTGSSILMQLEGKNDVYDNQILLTIADADENGTNYALEGIIRSCADSINWLNDNISCFDDINQVCNEVMKKEKPQDIQFIPALEGLGAPFWNNSSTGAFLGLRRSTDKEDLLYAVLESIIFQIKIVLERMVEVSGIQLQEVKLDGGVTKNFRLMQKLANLLSVELKIGVVEELSAVGALQIGNPNLFPIKSIAGKVYKPMPDQVTEIRYEKWKKKIKQFY